MQYCAEVASDWQFPLGDTIVAARVTDVAGNLGAPREIVVRVGMPGTPSPTRTPTPTRPTPTRTRTRTPTPTRTRTRTPTRPPASPTQAISLTATPTVPIPPSQTPTARATPTPRIGPCVGDCNGDGEVMINELGLAVNIALGNTSSATCPSADVDGDLVVSVGELVASVQNALLGCPLPPRAL